MGCSGPCAQRQVLFALLLAVGLAASACGGSDPKTSSARSTPTSAPASTSTVTYVESAQCREGARQVIDLLDRAMRDEDIRDAAARLDAVDGMGTMPTAECSGELLGLLREAAKRLECRLDLAMVEADFVASPHPEGHHRRPGNWAGWTRHHRGDGRGGPHAVRESGEL